MARKEELRQEQQNLLQLREQHDGEEDSGLKKWNQIWADSTITPLAPREMSSWLTNFEKCRDRASSLRSLRLELAELRRVQVQHRDTLVPVLEKLGEQIDKNSPDLGPITSQAEDLLESMDKEIAHRKELEARLTQMERDLVNSKKEAEKAEKDRKRWQGQWLEELKGLGLSKDTTTAEIADLLEALSEYFTKLDQAKELERRVEGIDKDIDAFQKEVTTFTNRVCPEISDLDPERAVSDLNARLTQAREASATSKKLHIEIEDRKEEIADADFIIEETNRKLSDLLKIGDAKSEDEFDTIEMAYEIKRKLLEEESRIENQLYKDGEGASIPQLLEEAQDVDADLIPGELEKLKQEIGELEAQRDVHIENKGRKEAELARMDGNSEAAQSADSAQEILAKLRRDVERYVRLKLASTILREQIERFRSENQSSLLQKGGQYFSRLTLNSFTDLMTDFDDQGEPVLVGLRKNGEKIDVSAMSSGTRDQLYLSLRLSTLEQFIDHAEAPLPFIVDDILINFDDERSVSTLEVLAELSKKTQVILFTHHSRVRDASLSLDQNVFVHQLNTETETRETP